MGSCGHKVLTWHKSMHAIIYSKIRHLLSNVCQLDLDRSLADQGPFDLILHKLTDQIAKANQGNNIAKSRVERFCVSRNWTVWGGVGWGGVGWGGVGWGGVGWGGVGWGGVGWGGVGWGGVGWGGGGGSRDGGRGLLGGC